MHVLARTLAIAGIALGCKGKPARDDAAPPTAPATAVAPVDAAPVIEPRPLGLAQLADYRWRARAGHAAFRAARTAEHAERWAEVVTRCAQAIAADPTHLEAQWLYAAALAKQGKPAADIVAALAVAEAGDFGKWGPASLELPAFAPLLATPLGASWRDRVEADRARYAAAIARATIVTAYGDLYAFDPEGPRWYRLTRTFGGVVAAIAFPDQREVVYLAVTDKTQLALGTIDLARGKTTRPTPLGVTWPLAAGATVEVAWGIKPPGAWVLAGARGWRVYADGKLAPAPAKATRPAGPWLGVTRGDVRVHRPRARDVSADWDEQSLASAIKINTSNRVVAVPSPGLIDGSTLAWSPDRARVAFLAQLDDPCAPAASDAGPRALVGAFVADAATGTLVELERGERALAFEWASDRALAIAGDHGVAIVDLDRARSPLADARGLLAPRHVATCAATAPAPAPDVPDDTPDDPDD